DGWSRNASYGWISEGLRSHLFLSQAQDLAVLTFKGTSLPFAKEKGDDWPTHRSDKFNDNLMFSCCCGIRSGRTCSCDKGSRQCDSTCYHRASHYKSSYYAAAMRMYGHVQEKYPKAIILLSGHSLGGSIAALVSAATRSPAVAFEAPGEAQFARRLGLIGGVDGKPRQAIPVWHIGHTADPIYTGTCTGINSLCRWFGYAMQTRCHLGRQCIFDTVGGLGWLPHVKYHR
ncbi:Alpha/Beta hydrolase protein, partial [Piptocephalis cylindrospora]